MCKHILNAQVAVRAPCCQRFFDCPQCHADVSDHPLARTTELAFVCKKCKRAFRRDLERYEEGSDDFCPHCDNCYVVQAKTAPQSSHNPLDVHGDHGADDEGAAYNEAAAAGVVPDARLDSEIYQALDPRQKYDPRRDFRLAGSNATEAGDRVDVGGLNAVVERAQEDEQRRRELLGRAQVLAAAGAGATSLDALDDELDWS